MANEEWLTKQLNDLIDDQNSFINKALLLSAKNVVKEQSKRIEQAKGEIDGRAWSPLKW